MNAPLLDPYTAAFWRPIQALEIVFAEEIAAAPSMVWLRQRATARLLAVLDHVVGLERRTLGFLEAKDGTTFRGQRIEWAQAQAGALVARVTQAQREAIAAAVADGRPVDPTARRIAAETGFSRQRAAVIARTELHNAATYAAEQEALAARRRGLDLVKVWTAAMDPRTRMTHRRANGQVREYDKPFAVGGARLMRPGDPRGPAREVINCRCVARSMPRMQIADDRQRRAAAFVDYAMRDPEPARRLGVMLTEMDPVLARVVRREAERRRIVPVTPIAPVPAMGGGEEGEDDEP